MCLTARVARARCRPEVCSPRGSDGGTENGRSVRRKRKHPPTRRGPRVRIVKFISAQMHARRDGVVAAAARLVRAAPDRPRTRYAVVVGPGSRALRPCPRTPCPSSTGYDKRSGVLRIFCWVGGYGGNVRRNIERNSPFLVISRVLSHRRCRLFYFRIFELVYL